MKKELKALIKSIQKIEKQFDESKTMASKIEDNGGQVPLFILGLFK